LRDTSAATSLIFGLVVTVLAGASGMVVDYGLMISTRAKLQSAADSAATAAARELQMANADPNKVSALAQAYVKNAVPNASVQSSVDAKLGTVAVTAGADFKPFLSGILSQSVTHIEATAVAKASGGLPLCLVALDKKVKNAIKLESNAQLTASVCVVYSNSTDPSGIQSADNSILQSGMTCSAGGVKRTKKSNFAPEPVTDCPPIPDPLADRVPPAVGGCAHTNTVIDGTMQTLQPGVYCGGLKVTNGAQVTLAPGVFIIKNGPLIVNKASTFRGTEVGIYLKGHGSNLTFDKDVTISLSAPKTGQMAGLLIFDDPTGASAPADPPVPLASLVLAPREHKILSDNARTLLGTIYMPQGRLIVDAKKPIADKSAYTVIVVRQLDLHDGPNLVLNSDYSATDVPVPGALGPSSAKVTLTK
jgi:Flp pilus assembly protein TadG